MEQKHILKHDANVPTKFVAFYILDIDPIDKDPSPLDVVKTTEDIDQRALTCTGWPHDSHPLPRLHLKGDPLQHRFIRIISKPHILEPNLSPQRDIYSRCYISSLLLIWCVEELKDPFRWGHSSLEKIVFFR